MIGATADTDGTAGLVPTPMAGQQNLYLQGNGQWSDPAASVKSDLAALKGADTNSTVRQIATDVVAEVINGADDSFDTLKEIADWILAHDNAIDVAQVTTDVSRLNEAVFGNNNDGLVYDVQTLEDIINGTPETTGLVQQVSNIRGDVITLNSTVNSIGARTTTLENQVTEIDNKLKWQDLVYQAD